MKNIIKTAIIVCALVFLFHGYGYCAQVTQNIDIKNGFNFISFTITPEFTPQTLISLYPDIENIYQYNSASGSFVSYGDGNLTALAPGRGYIVQSKASLTMSVSGQQEFSVGNINIKQGFNLVGFSKASAGVKFSSLLAVSSELKGIYKWAPSSGMFVQVVKNIIGTPEIFDGVDPQITSGQSYFIYANQDTFINYDSGVISVGSSSGATGGSVPADALSDVAEIDKMIGTGEIEGEISPDQPQTPAFNSPARAIAIVSLSNIKVWIKNNPEISARTDVNGKFTLKKAPQAEKGAGHTIEYEKK